MLTKTKFTETAGWIGVVFILIAYAFVSTGIWGTAYPAFHILNGIGAVGLVIDTLAEREWQPFVLNILWVVFAVVGLVNSLLTVV